MKQYSTAFAVALGICANDNNPRQQNASVNRSKEKRQKMEEKQGKIQWFIVISVNICYFIWSIAAAIWVVFYAGKHNRNMVHPQINFRIFNLHLE